MVSPSFRAFHLTHQWDLWCLQNPGTAPFAEQMLVPTSRLAEVRRRGIPSLPADLIGLLAAMSQRHHRQLFR